MKLHNAFVILTMTLGLAACFTSETPLINDGMAVAPYGTITYAQEGSDKKQVLTREGNTYLVQGEAGSTIRFAPVGDDLYVAQATADDNGKSVLLYALVAVDPDAGVARSYKAGGKPGDAGPGLHECGNDLICIDDLDAYIALAKKAYEDGATPDAIYTFTAG